MSKAFRLARIFRQDTGNALVLPIDHGLAFGNVPGLENPGRVLRDLMTSDIDAVLLTHGIGKDSEEVFHGRGTPARLLTSDTIYLGQSQIHHELVATPEMAVRRGYDCVKLIMFWDRPADERMQSVKLIADTVREAEKWEIPVMVEPLTFEPIEDVKERIKVLSDATRVAYELGADILKVAHPGDLDTLQSWVGYFKVPLIMLGGGKSGTTDEIVELVDKAIGVGVRGVAIGRNVWQRPADEAKRMLSLFAQIIHRKRREA